MEIFGIVGMVFGILGFTFALSATDKVKKLEDKLRAAGFIDK